MLYEVITLAAILGTPLVGLILVSLSGRAPNVREGITLTTAVVLFAQVLNLASDVMGGARPELMLVEMLPGMALKLTVEPLGVLFALIASGLWIVSSLYSVITSYSIHYTKLYERVWFTSLLPRM